MQKIWTLIAGRISTPSEKDSLIQPSIQPVVTKLPTMFEICCHYITQLGNSKLGIRQLRLRGAVKGILHCNVGDAFAMALNLVGR